ncbi:MAG: hypothetical protein M1835_003831, partial [Candelina submexicana]
VEDDIDRNLENLEEVLVTSQKVVSCEQRGRAKDGGTSKARKACSDGYPSGYADEKKIGEEEIIVHKEAS